MIPLSKQKPQAPSADAAPSEDSQEPKVKKPVPTIQGGVRMVSGMVWFSSLADVKAYI